MDFTHLDEKGNIKMVDVSEKPVSIRKASASGIIKLNPQTIQMIIKGEIKKGNVLTTAKLAGIMAAKKTYEIIPLCHQINLNSIEIDFIIKKDGIEAFSSIKCIDKTGAEMEALNCVTTSLLTIYDMCKAVDKKMIITKVKLCQKSKQFV